MHLELCLVTYLSLPTMFTMLMHSSFLIQWKYACCQFMILIIVFCHCSCSQDRLQEFHDLPVGADDSESSDSDSGRCGSVYYRNTTEKINNTSFRRISIEPSMMKKKQPQDFSLEVIDWPTRQVISYEMFSDVFHQFYILMQKKTVVRNKSQTQFCPTWWERTEHKTTESPHKPT